MLSIDRINHLHKDINGDDVELLLDYLDRTDSAGLVRTLQQVQPGEMYNLAAQVMSG